MIRRVEAFETVISVIAVSAIGEKKGDMSDKTCIALFDYQGVGESSRASVLAVFCFQTQHTASSIQSRRGFVRLSVCLLTQASIRRSGRSVAVGQYLITDPVLFEFYFHARG